MILASIFDNGAVYYPTLLGVPIVVGAYTGWRRRSLWILAGVVLALVLVDLAFDEERWNDLPFFVVVGVIQFGLGLLARFVAKRIAARRR